MLQYGQLGRNLDYRIGHTELEVHRDRLTYLLVFRTNSV